MTEPTTIRRCLERIIDHTGEHWPSCECISCLNYRDAVAALALLAAMEDELATQRDRADEWKRRYEFMETHPSYVPDSAPHGDA